MLAPTMHRLFPDGTILFADYSGLTRIDPKGSCKHSDKLVPDPCHALSIGGTPPRVGLTNALSGETAVLEVASLASTLRCKRSGILGIDPGDASLLVHDTWSADGHPHRMVPEPSEDVAPGAPLVLGAERPIKGGLLRVADRGHLLRVHIDDAGTSHAELLSLGSEAPEPCSWRVPVTIAPGALCMLGLSDEAAWLYSWQPRARVVHVARIDTQGQRSSVHRVLVDELVARGAQRIVSLGRAASGMLGVPHDAIEPLRRACKWIVDEINPHDGSHDAQSHAQIGTP